MGKRGVPLGGPAGLADWLPLLGSICQALSSIAEEPDDGEAREETDLAEGRHAPARPYSSSSASQ
jgi:hypothetical protein